MPFALGDSHSEIAEAKSWPIDQERCLEAGGARRSIARRIAWAFKSNLVSEQLTGDLEGCLP